MKNGNVFSGFVGVFFAKLRKGHSSLFFGDAARLDKAAFFRWFARVVYAWMIFNLFCVHSGPGFPICPHLFRRLLMSVYFCYCYHPAAHTSSVVAFGRLQ